MNCHEFQRWYSFSQRAAVAVESLPFYEAQAKERQGARNDLVEGNIVSKLRQSKSRDKAEDNIPPKLAECSKGESRDKAEKTVVPKLRQIPTLGFVVSGRGSGEGEADTKTC